MKGGSHASEQSVFKTSTQIHVEVKDVGVSQQTQACGEAVGLVPTFVFAVQ